MSTFALVDDATGLVVNRIVLDNEIDWPIPIGRHLVEEVDASFDIGGVFKDGLYSAPEPTPGMAMSIIHPISDRQFYQQLAVAGIITEDMALASNAAVIPAPLLALVGQMPSEAQFAAKMILAGATVFERNHPLTEAIGQAYGMSAAEIDAFFLAAAQL